MAAGQCSTGEQKALLIGPRPGAGAAVKAGTGIAPILLLDEVAAHLDRTRRLGLLQALDALGAQSWMTGTDAELFDGIGLRGAVFQVEDGTVKRMMES